ncbi:MAG: serine protease [Bacteriovorax sp.]|nr:serine protease [Bacteriovorax sp.]
MKTLCLLSLITLLSFGCKTELKKSTEVVLINSAIVGGSVVDPDKTDTTFIVNFGNKCSGSIVGTKWILTAAHCEESFKKDITAGGINLMSSNRIKLKLKKYFIHPNYTKAKLGDTNDFALIELVEPVDFEGTHLSSIKIADQAFVEAGGQDPGVIATALGWGRTSTYGHDSWKLRSVEMPIVSNEVANSKNSYDGFINDSMLAAGLDKGGKDTCAGDSGGPLIARDQHSGESVLVGVVSFGKDCGLPHFYGIYSKVSHVYDWIMETEENSEAH